RADEREVPLDQHLVGSQMRYRQVENADATAPVDDSAEYLLHLVGSLSWALRCLISTATCLAWGAGRAPVTQKAKGGRGRGQADRRRAGTSLANRACRGLCGLLQARRAERPVAGATGRLVQTAPAGGDPGRHAQPGRHP